ncbi:MAG: 50S ribosomal protein L25 [Pyrinomonadaceae bacterium]
MSEKIVVKAAVRETRGSNDARRLRRAGKIPVTVYGGGEDAVTAVAELSDLAAIIRSDSGVNTLFTLDIDGDENRVIFQDRQIDPVKGRLMHADLRRLAKGEKIEVTVPVNLVGEPIGVSQDGGLLEQQIREIRVLCTPSNIPESIDVDVSALELQSSITIGEVEVADEVEKLDDPDLMVASVTIVKEVSLEPDVAEEDAEPGVVGTDDESGEGGDE